MSTSDHKKNRIKVKSNKNHNNCTVHDDKDSNNYDGKSSQWSIKKI